MVAAYLRGLLKPHHNYGLRSVITEEIILETLVCEQRSEHLQSVVRNDMALVNVLNEKGLNQVMDRSSQRVERMRDLADLDLYRVEEQIAGRLKVSNVRNEMSLYQLYQVAERGGVLAALSDVDTSNFKPLL